MSTSANKAFRKLERESSGLHEHDRGSIYRALPEWVKAAVIVDDKLEVVSNPLLPVDDLESLRVLAAIHKAIQPAIVSSIMSHMETVIKRRELAGLLNSVEQKREISSHINDLSRRYDCDLCFDSQGDKHEDCHLLVVPDKWGGKYVLSDKRTKKRFGVKRNLSDILPKLCLVPRIHQSEHQLDFLGLL